MIQVFIPSQLESYTAGLRQVSVDPSPSSGATLTLLAVVDALDQRYRGLKFRIIDEQGQIRRHIAIFVGETLARTLDVPLQPDDRVQIVGALSGG